MTAIRVPADTEIKMMAATHCILTGDSPRNPVLHAVVGKYECGDLVMVHDPHPEKTGLLGKPKWVTFFCHIA